MTEIEAIARLVNQLSKLPGVGRKTTQRLAYHIIGLPEEQVRELAKKYQPRMIIAGASAYPASSTSRSSARSRRSAAPI